MPADDDSLPTAVLTGQEQDLKPLLEESIDVLDLDNRQAATMEDCLHEAWFLGIKTGHRVMIETKMGESDSMPVILSLQDEFQDVMERCAEGLNLTVQATIVAWNYLGQAWIAGAKFWEVEIAARLIEWQAGGSDGVLDWLED
jgi:hypothetical protein